MITLKQALSASMRVWAVPIENVDSGYVTIFDDACECLNGALQEAWSNGDDFFSRSTYSIDLVASNNTYDLPDTVQEVCDSCLYASDGVSLMRIQTEGEYRNFAQQVLGQVSNTVDQGRPQGYFVRQSFQTGNDPAKTTICFTPTPALPETVLLDVINEPSAYDRSDYCDDPTQIVPFPHKYGESVLIPLIQKRATAHFYASVVPNAELMFKQIESQYQLALQILTNIRTQKERNFFAGPNAYNVPTNESRRR